MADVAALTALLRAWDAGRGAAAQPGGVVACLRAAAELGIGAPAAAALRPAMPEAAARLLLDPVEAALVARAARASAQLAAVAEALTAAGVPAVALKGAAFLAEAPEAPPAWRVMGDLDLLVPPSRLRDAVAALSAAGYRGEHDAWVPTDYHWPALLPPGPGLPVELHAALAWRRPELLEGLAERALPAAMAGLALPAPDDRLAHLVHHAQIADRGHPARVARLRDAVDWRRLTEDAGADPAAVRARFAAAGQAPAFDAFAAFAAAVWQTPAPADPRARAWATDALAASADPARSTAGRRPGPMTTALEALGNRRLLAHAVAGMLNPVRLRRFARSLAQSRGAP